MIPADSLAALRAPLDDDEPCGPDLRAEGDFGFDGYMLHAEDALPERFFSGGEVSLDPSSLDLREEWEEVGPVMERTRDLRLLGTIAQFCAMARRLPALADCFTLAADWLEAFPEALHPRINEGSSVARSNALSLFTSNPNVVLPLEFSPLVEDRHMRGVSLRRIALARGLRNPVGAEQAEDASALLAALRRPDNAEELEATHAAIAAIAAAIERITEVCLLDPEAPFRPEFDTLQGRIDEIREILAEIRPDLAGEEGEGAAADGEAAGEGGASEAPAGGEPAAAAPPGLIDGPDRAAEALDMVEAYFLSVEPSSPGLILARQARQLVGRPLVEAIELLVPEQAKNARIEFADAGGFLLTMERMRDLSKVERPAGKAANGAGEASGESSGGGGVLAGLRGQASGGASGPAPLPAVDSRAQADAMMRAVEQFYNRSEPSSPIPLLLGRARRYLNASFAAILADLFPPPKR